MGQTATSSATRSTQTTSRRQFKDQTKGTTRPRVNLHPRSGSLRARLFAPQPEQTRIVEKLEELLSALDAGVTEPQKAAQKKLAQYRQSLLKAAMEGALTAEWRAGHQPTETGAQLLDRILTERRARWEAGQLAKFKEQGKTPPKDWQNKYPEPEPPGYHRLAGGAGGLGMGECGPTIVCRAWCITSPCW
ncbi:MAG: hypothetical protein IPK19_28500 [Chloroflexi bacterium]|nr:hypothetical protein [Chloroflexota bacterium]